MGPVGQALIRSLRQTGGAMDARPDRPTDPIPGSKASGFQGSDRQGGRLDHHPRSGSRLRRASPHQAAALDLPGSRLISRAAAGFCHRRPAAAGDMRLARGPFASAPAAPTTGPRGHPRHRPESAITGMHLQGSPTGSSPSTASSTPRPPAAARRLGGRACGSFPPRSCRESVALAGPLGEMAVPGGRRATSPAEVGRQVPVSMFTGGPVSARRGSQQPVAEQPGRWPVHAGEWRRLCLCRPGGTMLGRPISGFRREGSVEATRRHAWGCWA